MGNQYILRFHPVVKSPLWGGKKLYELKGLLPQETQIGEIWEISGLPGDETIIEGGPYSGLTINELIKNKKEKLLGKACDSTECERFPLIIKLIDAEDDLSIQVHPDDEMARKEEGCLGKNETWYVLEAEKDARIYAGFKRTVSEKEFRDMIEEGTAAEIIEGWEARKHQFYKIEAGTVHAIGKGCLILEIQDCSNLTYRVFDYNRLGQDGKKRELHVEKALRAIDFSKQNKGPIDISEKEGVLCRNERFSIDAISIKADKIHKEDTRGNSFHILSCVEGEIELGFPNSDERNEIRYGETILVPAEFGEYILKGEGRLLKTYLS